MKNPNKQKFPLFLFLFSLSSLALAQVSEIDMMLLQNYHADTSLVRNFEGKNNIIMSYGCNDNTYNTLGFCEMSSFFVQNIDNGQIMHLVDLPIGYKVNDMQLVYLKKKQNDYKVPYLCFCGTRLIRYDYYYPHQRDSSIVVIVPVTAGFVGYFRMDNVWSSSSVDSVVLRNVECSKELHRMTCYAEQYGAYSSFQNSFRDNAVLDIIGVAGSCVNYHSHYNYSSLWRVKFYPEYPYSTSFPSGTLWDNNIRYNTDNVERMIDIVGTDDYVVTVSQPENDNRRFWLRYSFKETSFYEGGMELNSNIQEVPLSSLQISGLNISNSNLTSFNLPVRLSHTSKNEASFAFNAYNIHDRFEGILVFKRDFDDYSYSLNGFFDDNATGLQELTFLPYNNASAYLFNLGSHCAFYTGVTYWDTISLNSHLTNHFSTSYIDQNSFCFCDLGYDLLSWSGVRCSYERPPYLSHQKIGAPLEDVSHCQSLSSGYSPNADITILEQYHEFPIWERYENNPITFEVTKIPFSPYTVEKDKICIFESKNE